MSNRGTQSQLDSDSTNQSGRDGTMMEEWEVREWGRGNPGMGGGAVASQTDNRSHKSLKKQVFWSP